MNRRRFLALIGASVPGLWLDGVGLIQLPRRMVIEISGDCSFCGKDAREVFGLAGIIRRPDRICNECIDICLEVLKDDLYLQTIESPPAPHPDYLLGKESIEAVHFEPIGLVRGMGMPKTKAELEEFMDQADTLLDQLKIDRHQLRRNRLSCSFCDQNEDEGSKLIAGPLAYICDICIGDAAALISLHC
jgi:ClpX C4-type zinc finger